MYVCKHQISVQLTSITCLVFMDHLAVPTDKGATGNQLKTVNSGHLRQLTGKMLIPNSRIRLLDTIGHGKVTTYSVQILIFIAFLYGLWVCVLDIYVTLTSKCFIFLSGEFGIVYKAHLLPKLQLDKSSPCPLPETVAVKTLKGKITTVYLCLYCTFYVECKLLNSLTMGLYSNFRILWP